MENRLTENIRIPVYMTDEYDRLTPSGFMKYAQEVGANHASLNHFGHRELLEEGLAWVVSRMHFHFDRPVLFGQRVSLTTWHMGMEGIFFRREYKMCDEAEQVLVRGTSSWVLLRLSDRSLVRSTPCVERAGGICSEALMPVAAARLRIPASVKLEKAFTYRVRQSDIDRNHHVNNTFYASWAMDALPDAIGIVTDFKINFNHEAHLGDDVELWRGRLDAPEGKTPASGTSGRWCVEGLVGGKQSFLVEVTLA